MDVFFYANAQTGRYWGVIDSQSDDPELIRVPTAPPDALHKWDGNSWISLTTAEVAADEDINTTESTVKEPLATPETTVPGRIAVWNDNLGSAIASSAVSIDNNGNLFGKIINATAYYLNYALVTLSTFLANTPQEGHMPIFRNGLWQSILPVVKYQGSFSVAINSGSVNTSFLRRQNGTSTDRCPYIIPYDCKCHTVAITCRPSESDDFNFRIFRNGTLMIEYLKPQGDNKAIYSNLNLEFNSGDAVSIQVSRIGNGNIEYPGGTLYFIQQTPNS